MTIKFKKILEDAVQPVRVANNGTGYNLVAKSIATDVNERGQINIVYRTGIGVEIPDGFIGLLTSPAEIEKKTIRMCSTPVVPGSIDEEIVVKYTTTTDVIPAVYNVGDVIANLHIIPVENVEFMEFIDMTSSATETGQSLPENEGEPTSSEQTDTVSGGEENIPEQAQ
jgi:dUTPase